MWRGERGREGEQGRTGIKTEIKHRKLKRNWQDGDGGRGVTRGYLTPRSPARGGRNKTLRVILSRKIIEKMHKRLGKRKVQRKFD